MEIYRFYGVDVASDLMLAAPRSGSARSAVTCRRVDAEDLPLLASDAIDVGWYRWESRADGSIRFSWPGLLESLVSADGREILVSEVGSDAAEAFAAQLAGHVLSFALVRLGLEPLHMTVIGRPKGAIALSGDSGYGKSTLAAAFLADGGKVLTDDLLVLRARGGELLAQPGLPRLKLEPEPLRLFFGDRATSPMAPRATKRLVPLGLDEWSDEARPLSVIYILRGPASRSTRSRITIRPMSAKAAHLAISASTFNSAITDRPRLERQFAFATDLVRRVPVRSLSYPPGLDLLPRVRDAILRDLAQA
jgi:hypothetical protein